jgi:hypothetical protein
MTTKLTTHTIHVVLKMPKKIGDFIIAGQKIHDQMALNTATLKNPSPVLTLLQTHLDDLTTKQALAKTRASGAVADRDAAKKVVSDDLNNERAYVESVVNADPTNAATIVGDAGMYFRKVTSVSKPPLAVKPGAVTGTVKVVAKATTGGKMNEWQYSTDGGKTWIDVPPTSKATTTIANLTPATTVMFRQRVFTKTGLSDWGQPVSALIN